MPVSRRIALIEADFHVAPNMKYVAADDLRSLIAYDPAALVSPPGPALLLADQKLRGLISLPNLSLAIVILSSPSSGDAGPLAAHHRDLLWKAFGLPVFEQLRGWDGRVFARECEVHDGLHVDTNSCMAECDGTELIVMGIATGLSADIEDAQCECGLETPRLCRLTASRARAAAA